MNRGQAESLRSQPLSNINSNVLHYHYIKFNLPRQYLHHFFLGRHSLSTFVQLHHFALVHGWCSSRMKVNLF